MDASYVFGRGAREYLAPLFYIHLAQIVVFPSACRRRLSNGYVSWRVYLFVGSFLSSAINCPYALRKCDWPWYPCLGNSGLVQACILLQIRAKALVTVGAPTSTTDRYLGACRSFLCGMVFLEVTCQVTSVPFFRFICFLTQTWPWAHCCVVRPASHNWKDLDTDSWFEAAAQSSAAPHMTIPSKMSMADA